MRRRAIDDPAAVLCELCRRSFPAFLRKAWPWINGGEELQWNWHLDAICLPLVAIHRGELRRALINVPPRNGKTGTVSVIWVAWMLGHDPTLSFVGVSYSNELSGKFGRDCRAIMESAWYREIFPGTVISRARSAAWDFETTRGGGRLSTSVSGTLTGRGGDIIILDDVIKPEDVNSDTARTAVNQWFQSTLLSRLNDKASGAIVSVMQRLHENDLTGMLLEHGGWHHLSLPAIATEDQHIPLASGGFYHRRAGEVLHPARESRELLAELKAGMGSRTFEAQYQQQPMPAAGNLFKAAWMRSFDLDPRALPWGEAIQSWDTGIKTGSDNDWSVCITAVMNSSALHIVDVWRGRLEFPDLARKVMEMARAWRAGTVVIEDKGSGQELLQTLHLPQYHDIAAIGRTPVQDKYSRAAGVSSMVEAGRVLLPRAALWLDDFQRELLAFPNAKFDDQVDAFSQLLDWVRACWANAPEINAGPVLFSEAADGSTEWSDGDHHDLSDDNIDSFGDGPWAL